MLLSQHGIAAMLIQIIKKSSLETLTRVYEVVQYYTSLQSLCLERLRTTNATFYWPTTFMYIYLRDVIIFFCRYSFFHDDAQDASPFRNFNKNTQLSTFAMRLKYFKEQHRDVAYSSVTAANTYTQYNIQSDQNFMLLRFLS